MAEIITKQIEEDVNVENLEKSRPNLVLRDAKGKLLPGSRLHPEGGGRPKGALSLTKMLRNYLSETEEGKDRPRAVELIQKLYAQAVKDGDQQTQRLIWNYLEGLPKQSIQHSGGIGVLVVPPELISKNHLDAQNGSKLTQFESLPETEENLQQE